MSEQQPPDDDPIIRSLREQGVRPLRPVSTRFSPGGAGARRRRLLLGGLLVLALVVLVLVPAMARRFADWLWYSEIGFERVFFTKIVAQWSLGLVSGIVAITVLYGTARFALAGMDAERDSFVSQVGSIRLPSAARRVLQLGVGAIALPFSTLLAFVVALGVASQWRVLLQYFYRSPFGVADPVFGRDVGYYVFSLPAIELATSTALALLWMSLLFVALPIYLARGEITMDRWRPVMRSRAQTHLALLAALLLVVVALRIHFVDVPGLLFGDHLPLSGANYVDLHARLPALRLLSVVALVGGLVILWGGWRGKLVPTATRVVAAYAVLAILAALVPAGYQRLVVQPNELARETPQIAHHIQATRRAWGLDSVQQHEIVSEAQLTPQLIAANRATIDNVRLWDREPLLQTFGQIQSIRTYYDFNAIDDDRYHIGGQLRQVLLSAREMNTLSLPTRGFINEHLTYTHGMGLTLGPSNAVTAEGLPVLFIKDLPPVSSIALKVTRPQIYYGEQRDRSNEFVLAPTRQKEFDYPAGEGDSAVYSTYDGKGGVSVGSFARRMLYAIRFGSLNIMLSSDVTDRTRILYYRDVRERAARALPFLIFDGDPYMVISDDGRLQWMLDGYTSSDRYPYSQLASGVNYLRNSVKVVIDAYDGTVHAYLMLPDEPIARTLAKIYPGLLRPVSEMPADLRAHIRYPEDLFRLQTSLYATYHMVSPETFYHREDQWQIPSTTSNGAPAGSARLGDGETFMRHMVMRLPGERDPEFILMRPFTPRQKDNLSAWIVARNDGDNYGKLSVYSFPRQSLVFGPNQIVNRIRQDTEVSRQITLWDQRGSEVLQGQLLVLPIEGALIYVQPLYLRAQGGRIPELKRVIAAQEGRVAMAETLDAALAALLGAPVPNAAPTVVASAADTAAAAAPNATSNAATAAAQALARQALQHFDRARAAQRADDWATYGDEMKKLGEVLRQMEAARARP